VDLADNLFTFSIYRRGGGGGDKGFGSKRVQTLDDNNTRLWREEMNNTVNTIQCESSDVIYFEPI
jgi:hypothetical protein